MAKTPDKTKLTALYSFCTVTLVDTNKGGPYYGATCLAVVPCILRQQECKAMDRVCHCMCDIINIQRWFVEL